MSSCKVLIVVEDRLDGSATKCSWKTLLFIGSIIRKGDNPVSGGARLSVCKLCFNRESNSLKLEFKRVGRFQLILNIK